MLTADGVNRLKKESSILKIPFDLHLVLVHVIGLPVVIWVDLNETALPL